MKTKDQIRDEIQRLYKLEEMYKNQDARSDFEREDNLEQAMRATISRKKLEWVLGW